MRIALVIAIVTFVNGYHYYDGVTEYWLVRNGHPIEKLDTQTYLPNYEYKIVAFNPYPTYTLWGDTHGWMNATFKVDFGFDATIACQQWGDLKKCYEYVYNIHHGLWLYMYAVYDGPCLTEYDDVEVSMF